MFRSRKCTNHEANSRRARQSGISAGASHTEQIAAHMPWPGAFPSTWQAHAAHSVFGQLERCAMWACAQSCPGLAVHDMPTLLSPATRPRCQFGSSDTPPAPPCDARLPSPTCKLFVRAWRRRSRRWSWRGMSSLTQPRRWPTSSSFESLRPRRDEPRARGASTGQGACVDRAMLAHTRHQGQA